MPNLWNQSLNAEKGFSGKDVYIIQPAGENVNDNLMELLIAISACKTASARKASTLLIIELLAFALISERSLLFYRYRSRPQICLQVIVTDLEST